MKRLTGISGRLVLFVVTLIVLACGVISFLAYTASSKTLQQQTEASLISQANDVKMYMEESFARLFNNLEAVASTTELQQGTTAEQLQFLETQLSKHEAYQTFGIVNEDGNTRFLEGDEINLADRDYIQEGFTGETVISEVLASRLTEEPALIIVTPIERAGEKQLLLAHLDGYLYSEIAEQVKVGETGFALILSDEGTIQGHKNREWVKERLNFIEQAEQNGTMLGEANAIQQYILPNDSGIAYYESVSGGQRYIGFSTLSNGWKVGIVSMEEEFLAGLQNMTKQLIVSALIVCIIAIIFVYIIAQTIVRPIINLVHVSEVLADGDFAKPIEGRFLQRKDEVGLLAKSLQMMQERTRTMIRDMRESADHVQQASTQMEQDIEQLKAQSVEIVQAIQQVGDNSTTQAQMANETAQSMEQMTHGIQNVADVASTIVTNSDYIQQKMTVGQRAVDESIAQMQLIELETAREVQTIQLLAKESQEIGQITNIITEIADQTNLLALNAAIEAARAGDAGKGFAVVADEVRKLSEQTAHSASRIQSLIASVQTYTKEAVVAGEGSARSVRTGLRSIEGVGVQFTEIKEAMRQINEEIESMSAAAEQMSASTEQTSATMEEMSATAQLANERVEDVTTAVVSQSASVERMNNQTEELAQLAITLQQKIAQFKI